MDEVYKQLKKAYSKTLYDSFYFWCRWRMVPFELMNSYFPNKGNFLDIGCGEGIFANFIARKSSERNVFAIDQNASRLESAKRACSDISNIEFKKADATTFKINNCTGISMTDFLHHIPYEEQVKVLERCLENIDPEGYILIREIDKNDGWKYYSSFLSDILLYRSVSWFRTLDDWMQLMEKIGFRVAYKKPNPLLPLSSVLFILQR